METPLMYENLQNFYAVADIRRHFHFYFFFLGVGETEGVPSHQTFPALQASRRVFVPKAGDGNGEGEPCYCFPFVVF